jgi:uncharacterized protein YceK
MKRIFTNTGIILAAVMLMTAGCSTVKKRIRLKEALLLGLPAVLLSAG